MNLKNLVIGIDVGSTTVKAVVTETESMQVIWSDYQRHDTKQAEKVLEFLQIFQEKYSIEENAARIFMTGSGAANIASLIGAKFVQEVNAVSLSVESRHEDVGSVVELGGQDAKIIIWSTDPKTGNRRKTLSMNDKCAGGTGAVIDKICAKLRISNEALGKINYRDARIHPVAGKCGVFAETDINGLQKQGVPADELMASLFSAIVQQNLSVLTRGNTLTPRVLLLGGPNTFIPAMIDAWKTSIPKVWAERGLDFDGVDNPEDLIIVPAHAELYAAWGCVLYGLAEPVNTGIYQGQTRLKDFILGGRSNKLQAGVSAPGLVQDADELKTFIG
ncbi:MAG TPA: CoA activase, partial [Gammaproteobacteria bacterium]|nr:CoA activase [Gammaproteobacteria bacterium]